MYEDVSGGICVPSRFTFGSLLEKQSAVLGPPPFLFSFFSTKSGRFGTKHPRREEGTREGQGGRALLIPGERTKSRRGQGERRCDAMMPRGDPSFEFVHNTWTGTQQASSHFGTHR